MKTFFLSVLTITLSFCPSLMAGDNTVFQFPVKHDHFWGAGLGDLTIDQEGIAYNSEKDDDHFRRWSYADIQEVKIESPQRIYIRTYEDVWWKLNRERVYKFQLIDGEISADVVHVLRERLPTALVSAVFTGPDDAFYMVPVKHGHTLGTGCEGQLLFSRKGVYYASSNSEHGRFWPIEDIESLGRMSSSHFRITVREHSHSGSIRNFQFQLKRPMDEVAYELFWRKIYEPESWLNRLKTETFASSANPFAEQKK
ncbi:hypothetical protein MYX78_03500 [Acidobacteria bacterium AH-259-G07]|nr:hypothetical protein [Acidobacteria bacterium AH-259-G07]